MIERLRRKFIVISILSVILVLTIITSTINISNYIQINNQADEILEIITSNNGHFPKPQKPKEGDRRVPPEISPEAPFSTRFFTIRIDENENVLTIDTGNIAAITTKEAVNYAEEVLKSKDSSGFLEIYRYSSVKTDYGRLIVFLDFRKELETFKSFLKNSILISTMGVLSVFILILIFSKKVIKPIAESYEKQKRFITDAGHEIKTPLTIIDTSAEVLELDHGENEWTNSIKNQVKRLTQLTTNLVTLSRMDEENSNFQMTDFSLSDTILESAEPFLTMSKAQNKEFILDIERNLSYYGNESLLRQLVSILLDNAIKYTEEKGAIKLYFKKKGKHIILSVYNTTNNINQGNLNILFDRFYRHDSSRNSKTGGYGIGLSIAKAIVNMHKGKIKAESIDGKSIIITVQL